MSKRTKGWLLIGSILVALGLLLFCWPLAKNQWDFAKLSTEEYEMNTYVIQDGFKHISLETDTADLEFVLTQDDQCKVACKEKEHAKHTVAVENGTLTIREVDERPWYTSLGIVTESLAITVYLPDTQYDSLTIAESTGDIHIPGDFCFEHIDITASTGDVTCNASANGNLSVTTDTGDIRIEDIRAKNLALAVSTGNITANTITCQQDVTVDVSTGKAQIEDMQCTDFLSTGDTGRITLENVLAAGKISIERSTGDVTFECCDATQLNIETDTGDVTGSLLSEKIFITETDTGDVDIPVTVTGGKCQITTSTGDIQIELVQ